VAKLLEATGQEPISERRLQLIALGHRKATEFINRSYARITGYKGNGERRTKANGKPSPKFAVPEAFEYVSTIGNFDKTVALAGAHTPLAWAVCSLFSASRHFQRNLKALALRGLTPRSE
jgi:hypothetical protein